MKKEQDDSPLVAYLIRFRTKFSMMVEGKTATKSQFCSLMDSYIQHQINGYGLSTVNNICIN